MKKTYFKALAALLSLTLALSACSNKSGGNAGNAGGGNTAAQNGSSQNGEEQAPDTGGENAGGAAAEPPSDPSKPSEILGSIKVNTYTPPGDPVTFTMFIATTGDAPPANNKIVKMIEEYTGVHIDMEFLVGELEQKMGIMIASGDYPDLIMPQNGRSRYMSAGAFIPLDDLIPKYPNINKHYAPYLDKLRNVSPDGDAIYLMDIWGRYYWYGENSAQYMDDHEEQAFWIQKDVLAEAGYPNPKTLDEFFDILESYYKKHPTIDGMATLPFEVESTLGQRWCLINPPQHLIGAGNDGDAYVNLDTFTTEIYHNKWYAKDYYLKLNEAYKKGLISPETFTQNHDQYLAKVATGRVLAMFDAHWSYKNGENVLISENKYERTYVPVPITYEGYESGYLDEPYFVGGNGIGISVACADPERVMQYIDTLLNEDLQRLMSWGIEGEDYYIDTNGRYRHTAEQKLNWDNHDWQNANSGWPLRDQFPKIQGMFSDGNSAGAGAQPEEKAENAAPYDQEFYSHYPWKQKNGFLRATKKPEYYPLWGISNSFQDGTDAKIALDEIWDIALRGLPGVIMADNFENAWTEYAARYDKVNYKALEDEFDRQIAIRMGITR